MEKSARVAIARQIIELIDNDTPFMGEESWEADIGRFIDKDRFELEKRMMFLERPQLLVGGGGWLLARSGAPSWTMFALAGAAMIVYGLGTALSIRLTRWGK